MAVKTITERIAGMARLPSWKSFLTLLGLSLASGLPQAGWLDDVKASLPGGWGVPPHRIVDSGYWVRTYLPHRTIYWVDSDRVIFVGGTRAEWERFTKEGFDAYVPYLYIWDTRSNQVSIHSKIDNSSIPCYSQGYIRYYVPGGTNDQRVLKSGPFGQETETLDDRKHNTVEVRKSRGMLYSELRCKEYAEADVRISPTRLLFPLLDGHGYLNINFNAFVPDEKYEPVFWLKDRENLPVELPIRKYETAWTNVSYVEWSNTYVIEIDLARDRVHNSTGDWPKNVPRPVYLMKPGGAVQQVNLPYIDRVTSNASYFFPMRSGMAFLSKSVAPNKPGKAGVYIWAGGDSVHRVAEGLPKAAALSPDGCKLAVAIDPRDHGGPNRYYLKMIDFCAKGNK